MTVREDIGRASDTLTASERKISSALLADYPFAGLQPIQELAARSGVSAPSITRFVGKIGYAGYQQFQRRLIDELEEGRRSPAELQAGARQMADADFLADYARRAASLVSTLAASVPQDLFERVCQAIRDPRRDIYFLGGRISDTTARFLSVHLRQIRPGIHHMPSDPECWPDGILRMRRQDVLVLFDFRRYQPELAKLARMVRETRRARIVLVTDRWLSPAAEHCDEVLGLPIEIGTAWDTLVCATVLAEAIIVNVSESDWPRTKRRLEEWDGLRIAGPEKRWKDGDEA